MLTLVIFIVLIAFVFDFLNGFHDAANSIATVVSTRVLTPRAAVAWAAFFNLSAAFIFDVHVANTLGKGLIHLEAVNEYVIMCGLLGAIAWDLITWYYGLPASSSHALMGGYAGAAIAKAGFGAIIYNGWTMTLLFIVLAPLIGMIMGFFFKVALMWIFHDRPSSKINKRFRRLQLLSAALYSLGHGANDAQKTMGVITLALVTAGQLDSFVVPTWVIAICAGAIAVGTGLGGWRLIRTLGGKFFKIRPVHGFATQLSSAAVILGAALLGGPVSTTQVVSSAIMGVGAAERVSKVRWGVAGNIATAWFLTIPATATLGALVYLGLVAIVPLREVLLAVAAH